MSEKIAFQYRGIFVIFSKRVVFKHVVVFLTLNKKQKSAENKLIIFSGLEFSFCCFVVHILFLFCHFWLFCPVFAEFLKFWSVSGQWSKTFWTKLKKFLFYFVFIFIDILAFIFCLVVV